MPIPKLNFSTGNVVDPTKGALQGVTAARNTLQDYMKQLTQEDLLAKEQARQKGLDDRVTAEYEYKLTERTKAENADTQKQAYLNALKSPGEMFVDKNVQRSLMSPEVMTQVVNNNPVLSKAFAQGTEALTPEEKVKYEEHFKQMDKLGQIPTEQMGILDAADLYGVLGGEYAATESINAKKALEKARNEGLAGLNKQETEMTLARLAAAKKDSGSSSSRGATKNMFGTKVQSPMDIMKDAQGYHEKQYAQDGKSGKLAKPINTLTQLMANKGYDAAQINTVVDQGYKPSTKWGFGLFGDDATLTTPTDAELISAVGAPRNVATPTGYSATDKKYDDQIAKVGKDYLDAARNKIENRGVDKPTRELFDSILNNTYGNVDSTTPSKVEQIANGKSTEKQTSTKVGGQIGAAINTKGVGGELAKLKLENPQEFANEYELLKPAQQARVDKVLGSEASKKVFTETKKDPTKTSISLRDALSTSKPLVAFPTESRLSPGSLDILRQLNPTGMTDQEKMMAQFEAEDRPLEDMSLSLIPGLKAAKTVSSQMKLLTKAGYSKAKAEALIKSGKLKLLPERPSQINVPVKGFTNANRHYDISIPAMRP